MALNPCAMIDQNFTYWGPCFQDKVFLGDPVITTIGVLVIMFYIAYKLNIPRETSIMLGTGVVFMMGIISGEIMYSLVALVVFVLSIMIIRAVMKPAKN